MDTPLIFWGKVLLGAGACIGALIGLVIYVIDQSTLKQGKETEELIRIITTRADVFLIKGDLEPVEKVSRTQIEKEGTNGIFYLADDLNGFMRYNTFVIVDRNGNDVEGMQFPSMSFEDAKKKFIKAGLDTTKFLIAIHIHFSFAFKNKGKTDARDFVIEIKSRYLDGSWRTTSTPPTILSADQESILPYPKRFPTGMKVPEKIDFQFTITYSDIFNEKFKKSYRFEWQSATGYRSFVAL